MQTTTAVAATTTVSTTIATKTRKGDGGKLK